ncbi:MAG: paraquat-inducible protein A [Pseudomonadota bacterium]
MKAGLVVCRDCHKLIRFVGSEAVYDEYCPRCGCPLHFRNPGSLSNTWALVITGAILFIPANTLPIMTVKTFGHGEADTIMSGIIHLMQAGLYPLAFIVFVASIVVPLLKITGIVILLLSVQFRWSMSPSQRTLMYRWIEYVGRWSMLDIFVITILVALVDLGNITTVRAGPGASAFAAVVVLTMLAANCFDARLIWDIEA